MPTAICALSLLLFSIYSFRRHTNVLYLLPAYYSTVILYTMGGSSHFDYAIETPFSLYSQITESSLNDSYYVFLIAAISFFVGTSLSSLFIHTKQKSVLHAKYFKSYRAIPQSFIWAILFLTILCLHLGVGFAHVYSRTGYTIGSQSGSYYFRILFFILLPACLFLLPFARKKTSRLIPLLTVLLLVQGLNSRISMLIPICYYAGTTVRDSRINLKQLAAALLIALLLCIISLQYRNNDHQGIIGNIISLFTIGIDWEFLRLGINYATSYSIYSNALTVQNFQISANDLLLTLSPLPGSQALLESTISAQMINQYSPFPAIGSLALGGLPLVIMFFFLSAIIWNISNNVILKMTPLLTPFTMVLFGLFVIYSTQYNLRGTTRLLYYSCILCITAWMWSIIKYQVSHNTQRNLTKQLSPTA